MDFLLGNPYSTPVGQCVERATDGGLQNEDWALNMEICDIVNETDEGPKDAMRALKKRLGGNKNYREVMLALTVVETCVKNCGHRFHVQVANRDFVDGVLVKIISPKANAPAVVQDKVLSLIQAWADAFRSRPDLTGVVHVYEELKRKGTEFPVADPDALSPIHTPQRGTPEVGPATIKYVAPASSPAAAPSPKPAAEVLPRGPVAATPRQVARLRGDLDVVRGNVKVLSEMLTETVPGQEDGADLELLQELHGTCKAMQQRVVELVSRVSNEEVTEELLHVNDDLNNVFLRYERYERYRSGRGARNKEILGEPTDDNLIDLGPGSPAAVTPGVPSGPPRHGDAAPNPAEASLSSALAGLDVGLASGPNRNQDDFDMFAQTRSSSLAEQRKNVKYEDPQASALDVRQHDAGGIPVSQSSVMDDIEEWLCADVVVDDAHGRGFNGFIEQRRLSTSCHWLTSTTRVTLKVTDATVQREDGDPKWTYKGDAPDEEGVTSEEFDQFLEERAKGSETSPPADDAARPARAHKKARRTEDALFAL